VYRLVRVVVSRSLVFASEFLTIAHIVSFLFSISSSSDDMAPQIFAYCVNLLINNCGRALSGFGDPKGYPVVALYILAQYTVSQFYIGVLSSEATPLSRAMFLASRQHCLMTHITILYDSTRIRYNFTIKQYYKVSAIHTSRKVAINNMLRLLPVMRTPSLSRDV